MPPIPKKTGLAAKVAKSKAGTRRKEPLWKGPEEDGITQSLLSRFIVCRERFRLLVVEGLKPHETFSHRMEYGNFWHICEEAVGNGLDPFMQLAEYARQLATKYRTQQDQVQHWYRVCKTQFPIYLDYWKKHQDVKGRVPLAPEFSFAVPYKLPSGRVVKLRGKFDSVDLIKGKGVYLQENKCRGDIDEIATKRQLRFDLQTQMYLTALTILQERREFPFEKDVGPIMGVRYNVIKRPLSGGAGSIRKHQPSKSNPRGETDDEFYARVAGVIREKQDEFFMRWTCDVSQNDLRTFQEQCFNPLLESLCTWWENIKHGVDPFSLGGLHWRTPYGFYNVLAEGGETEIDEYLNTGNEVGLYRTEQLFPELA